MSIVWADFPSGQIGLYGADESAMLDGLYAQIAEPSGASVTLIDDPDPNIGSAGKVISVFGGFSSAAYLRFVNPGGANATGGMAFRLWQTQLPEANDDTGNAEWTFSTAANTTVCYLRAFTDGSIGAYNSANTLLGTSSIALTANAFHHVETKVLRHASTGTIEVRVDGVSVLSLTGLALGADDIGMVRIGSERENAAISTPSNRYKDFVVWDGVGSVGNDFQGSVAVRDLYPDADISLNWTPSTGATGWDLIDETTPDDADYIQAGDPPPAAYKASLTDLPVDVTSVRALLPICRSVKTDGGDCSLQIGLTPNDTDWDDGADNPLTTAFTYRWDVSELSPATAAAWTPTEVNAAYVRANRTL